MAGIRFVVTWVAILYRNKKSCSFWFNVIFSSLMARSAFLKLSSNLSAKRLVAGWYGVQMLDSVVP